ncbi:MAG: hypothetical protein ACLQVM_08085 [Terriglobia bacterium]
MDTNDNSNVTDPEINAISILHNALKSLDTEAQIRVVQYVTGKLGIGRDFASPASERSMVERSPDTQRQGEPEPAAPSGGASADSSAGISPVAQKWSTRNGLNEAQLGTVFSLGGDEIDLIAESVPGKSKRNRMHSVILLKGVAAYLASGAARVSHQQIKETCLHYDAYDSANFAAHLKKFGAEVSGSKESGYTLTARGLARATNLVKQMTQGEQA